MNDYRLVELTRGMSAVVDAEDYDRVMSYGLWRVNQTKSGAMYAQSVSTFMQTAVTGRPLVDHRNSDGLDNRRSNLRVATASQNGQNVGLTAANTSGYRGVSRSRGKWQAQIKINGKNTPLGRFSSAQDAALAYDIAARRSHGAFAYLNFPSEQELYGGGPSPVPHGELLPPYSSARRVALPASTGVRGVIRARNGRYIVQASFDGKQHYLGRFDTVQDAVSARDSRGQKS